MAVTLTNTTPTSTFRQVGRQPRKVTSNSLSMRTLRVNCTYSSDSEHVKEVGRRNILLGLGSLCGIAASAKAANADYGRNEGSPMQPVSEFGSQPRALDKVIRALVDVPKKKKETVILAIDDIDIPNDDPIRFDVYIAEPVGNMVSPDYGEYVGSEVDIAHKRNKSKGMLELGITYMLEDMGAEDTDKLVVTLVPRTGKVNIGGVHIETI